MEHAMTTLHNKSKSNHVLYYSVCPAEKETRLVLCLVV